MQFFSFNRSKFCILCNWYFDLVIESNKKKLLKEFRSQVSQKYGVTAQNVINAQLLRLSKLPKINQKILDEIEESITQRLNGTFDNQKGIFILWFLDATTLHQSLRSKTGIRKEKASKPNMDLLDI